LLSEKSVRRSFLNVAVKHTKVARAQPYIAPTWSWASLDGPIWIQHSGKLDKHETVLIKILDSTVETGLDPTGAVFSGKLSIRAPAPRSSLNGNRLSGPYFRFHNPDVVVRTSWDEINSVPCNIVYLLVVTTRVALTLSRRTPHKLFGDSHWTMHGIVLRNSEIGVRQCLPVGKFTVTFWPLS
jgi:hypothetical protein